MLSAHAVEAAHAQAREYLKLDREEALDLLTTAHTQTVSKSSMHASPMIPTQVPLRQNHTATKKDMMRMLATNAKVCCE